MIKGEPQPRELCINGNKITPLQNMPVKYLGKKYTASLNEKEQIQNVIKMIEDETKKIDQCKLPGRYKSWILQHMLIPRLMWPLRIYNIPLTTIENLQKLLTKFIKKWLGIPKNLSTASLYSKSAKLRLPFSELQEEFKTAKACNLATFQNSKGPCTCISGAELKVDAGRKTITTVEIDEAKSRLRMQEITGVSNKGREGLGMRKREYFSLSTEKRKREMIINEVKKKEEETRIVQMTQLAKQGQHLRWEVPQRRVKPDDLLKMPDERLKFIIKAVYDLLPTPANKNLWYGGEERCQLCGQEGTLSHILSGCRVALSQGRY